MASRKALICWLWKKAWNSVAEKKSAWFFTHVFGPFAAEALQSECANCCSQDEISMVGASRLRRALLRCRLPGRAGMSCLDSTGCAAPEISHRKLPRQGGSLVPVISVSHTSLKSH